MKRLLGWIALGTVAAFALAQGSGSDVVNAFAKAVSSADSLSVNYTAQTVGEGQREYKLDFAKPNKARIETGGQLIVADGANITTYDKKANSYFKQSQTKDELMKLFADQDISLWKVFFDPAALSKVKSKSLGNRTLAGTSYRVVEVAEDSGGRVLRTLFIDNANMVRRAQLTLKDPSGDASTVYVMKESTMGATPGDKFDFKAPDGAKEVTMEEMMSAEWLTDLEKAKEIAAKTKRKIFVDFYADW